ncbi:MAG: glutamate 5-kinase [Gemmataceae bacterium]|nr:glutamate 5-kinase [Gemmataceae bacterium]MDW8266716.1 glutamate 5-kinase [Gemmataceae bacterium]
MVDPVRQEVIASAHTVVIKVGTNVLTGEDGRLNRARVQALADQVQRLRQSGRRVALVSSGAVGAGVGRLGLPRRPTDLRHLQACAAVGQGFLMGAYEECLARHGTPTAQILLTASDFDNRTRYLNVRNTILTLFEWGCLPIINENDTVSVAEIRFGDNDLLAAMVTNLLQAPLLILLTVVDGLYTGDPRLDPQAQLLTTVPHIDRTVTSLASSSRSPLGTGGMVSKLRAARLATAAGESVIMANGTRPDILDAIFTAAPVGTLFLPHGSSVPAWKRWLGYTARPLGRLIVDAGAQHAVQHLGRSLLPIGVVRVEGTFHKGDVVALCSADGTEFARGLSNYSSHDAQRICGLRREQIAERLGMVPYEEIVHRDNLAVLA